MQLDKLRSRITLKLAPHDNERNSRMTWLVINDLTSRKMNGPFIKEIKQNGISIRNRPDRKIS